MNVSPEKISNNWWSADLNGLYRELDSSEKGLTAEEAADRFKIFGANRLAEMKRITIVGRFIAKLFNPLILMLLAAGFVSAILGQRSDFIIIAAIVVVSTVIDVIQEHKAETSAEKLRQRVSLSATVLRDHAEKEIPLVNVVPGDVVIVKLGDFVPADCRIIKQKDLLVDESALTGESLTSPKNPEAKVDEKSSIGSRVNSLFMGTNVISGEATALVVATGGKAEFGEIAKELIAPRPPTEFEKGINSFGNLLLKIALIMAAAIFILHVLTLHDYFSSLLFVLALVIGFAPELLPAVITINLSKGAIRMSKKGVIVKSLPAIENFGSMEILATDKTGTLTENKISLARSEDIRGIPDTKVITLGYLTSFYQTGFKGPMEEAILVHKELDISKYKFISCVPFDFYRKRLSVVVKSDSETIFIVKGSPEEIIKLSDKLEIDGKSTVLDEAGKKKIRTRFDKLSGDGLRLLAIAYKKIKTNQKSFGPADEKTLTFLGFLGFEDPPKHTATEALTRLTKLGLSIKIITGDNELVTEKISRDLGLAISGIATSADLENLSDHDLGKLVEKTTIFARINPDQKEKIIKAMRNNGHVVGYLGDGINDATSLRTADIGISVDNAVDVAKASADIILLHKDLHVLLDGVHEGRVTFGNIMKYLMMGTSSTFGNMLSLAAASVFLPFLPMLPVQVLLNDLLYDVSQLLVASDNVDSHYLTKPKKWDVGFIRKFMTAFGPVSSVFDFVTFYILLTYFHSVAKFFQTGWFVESIVTQTLIVLSIRTAVVPFFKSRPSWAFAISVSLITLVALVLPQITGAAKLFELVALPPTFYLIIAGLTVAYFVLVETVKLWFYKYTKIV